MWRRLSRYGAQAQLIAVIFLAGCAADPQVVAVKTQLPKPPASCRTAPKDLPRLPDRALKTSELAQGYNRLQAQYRREVGRYRLCQKFVARL